MVRTLETVQKEIEVILTKHLASYLAMPIFLIDPDGNLLYYNEQAEKILGLRFEETDEMPMSEWLAVFKPTDEEGALIAPENIPLVTALVQRCPSHGNLWIHGLDGKRHHIEVTGVPLIGQADRYLGAVAIFWEIERK